MTVTLVRQNPQQHRMEQRQVHGLDEELLGAVLNSANGHLSRALTYQRDDRDAGLHVLDALQQLKCISIRQRKVEDGRIRTEVADSRTDDWIDVDDQNSMLAQALTCCCQKCSRVLQCLQEKPRSSWEQ